MAYEIDFIGVSKEKCKQDADAICLRWKIKDELGNINYIIGVVDGGFEAHGDAMTDHMNQYYFNDSMGILEKSEKEIDFIIVTHPDQDHTIGLLKILENFKVKKIYMNRPWLYVDYLYKYVNDGRITKASLETRLREKYKTIADIEDLAKKDGIAIYEAFQGDTVEDKLLFLSPSKEFYLQLLIESEKTPLTETAYVNEDGIFASITKFAKEAILSILETWDFETLREGETTTAENESSIITRGVIEGSGFLLTGDAGIRGLSKAMDYMDYIGEDIIKDISFYQIPHHGGRHNVSPSVLNRMLGGIVRKGTTTKNKTSYASVAEGSNHPLKMVTNAYIRRGIKVYKTDGYTISHHNGEMPDRGWGASTNIEFSDYVEKWDE